MLIKNTKIQNVNTILYDYTLILVSVAILRNYF